MGLFEAHEEKKFDSRVIERARAVGKLDKKSLESFLKSLPDEAANASFVNLDELNAKDNPVHIPRGLPSLEAPVRKNLEDLEFEGSEESRNLEQ